MQVAGQIDQLRDAGCDILVVTQATPTLLRKFLDRYPQPFPVVGDPERTAYRSFGLTRTSWLTFFKPNVLWGYLRLMVRGMGVRMPSGEEDVRQLGGDFLLDRSGRLVWKFTSDDPTARPTTEELLQAIRAN